MLKNELLHQTPVKKATTTSKAFKALFLTSLLFSIVSVTPAQQWPIVGSDQPIASGASNYTAIATAVEGDEGTLTVPYVVFTEANIARVKKYIDGAWQQVGNDVSSGTATYTKIYIDVNNKIYVTYVDGLNGNRLAVKTYDTAAQKWGPLNNDVNNLYVSTGSVTNSISAYNTTQRSALAFDSSNMPYIVFSDGSGLNPFVKKYNGTAWQTVGAAAVSDQRAVGISLAIDSASNNPYIVYINLQTATSSTGNLRVFRFTGTTWDSIPLPLIITSGGGTTTTGATTAVRHTNIAFNSSWNPVVSYFNANNSNKTTIITYSQSSGTWTYGGTLSGRDITYNYLYRDNGGNLYSSFVDIITAGSGKSVARVMKQKPGSTTWVELKATDAEGIDNPTNNLSITVGADTSKPYIIYNNSNSTPSVRQFTAAVPPVIVPVADPIVTTAKQMEKLNRGLVAVRTTASQVYVGWRLFGKDPATIGFNLYRNGTLLNAQPITSSTNYVDNTTINGTYTIKPVISGIEQNTPETAGAVWTQSFLSIPMQIPAGGTTPDGVAYTYSPNDASVGDVDGDGEYEIILKWDPSNSKDNSQSGYTGNVYLDAYKLNGTRLWRIDLGKNIRAGAHYTQLMVYDFDGDGKAEVACKTADGTIDGVGTVIGSATADYRTTAGYILSGPEFLTMFNGLTGAAMSTVNFIPARGSVASWGDSYGNRVDRFISAVAYLDGAHPSLIMGRGYYTRLVRAAWDFKNGQLISRWVFDSNTPGNGAYAGQGNHQLTVGDVDGDGKDEIINGASAINDDGKGLYAPGLGHGDALHMSDLDPSRPGQEVWQCHEDPGSYGNYGLEFRDAKTGQALWGVPGGGADVGRCMTADIDSTHLGYEVWGSVGNLYDCKGTQITTTKPSVNFGIWWDGDLCRELLDGTKLDKWNSTTNTSNRLLTVYNYGDAATNNSTKANPCLTADILGDWREEMLFRSADNTKLLLFTTAIPTNYRMYTLMHDPQYRTQVALENSAYNQPPNPGFYLGTGMTAPPVPNIFYAIDQFSSLPVKLLDFKAVKNGSAVDVSWSTANETNNETFTVDRSKDGNNFTAIYTTKGAGTTTIQNNYTITDDAPFAGTNYYRLKQTDVDGKFTYSAIRVVEFASITGKLSISPNPVTNSVRLNFNSQSSNLKLVVTTSDGKVIMKLNGSISQLSSQLNTKISNLNSGLYLVQLWEGTKRYEGKIIKQK